MRKLRNKRGFTLAELLIVVAIIAVLVGISIPVFGAQVKKAQFAADLANVRANYAEHLVEKMVNAEVDEDGEYKIELNLSDIDADNIKKATVTVESGNLKVTLGDWEETIIVDEDVTINEDTTGSGD